MRARAGFSLVELMIAITVMTFVTGIVVVQFSGFDSAIVTKARAYDAAQAVRAAQAYATQIRAASSTDTAFATQYLARFTKGSEEILIMRKEGEGTAQPIEYRQLTAGYKTQKLCTVSADGSVHAASTVGQMLDIAFQRPDIAASSTPSWAIPASPVVRSYVGIAGADLSLIHWIEVDHTGSVAVVPSALLCE
ncbi:hypothetical protein A3C89_02375 [Candidatus Kaiserbacteria bacterium RIFCSPHIGHO2_02_FULL_50_50]|uniref:Prepilin-type N-terminal cleavage/methylation domain-containing protein n=1 Tax=Candidatus Kaiserbacteria bacterium RIFCSPHIGHO2_02_FULL_50_50 TaxID=1798492 RepID=A0A1F6DGB8_9BACT|nr:MAG: hypothetical protein A3C89_02375 [Candidatus Kaiserbacteria bacterium RIFCSPHIGHO2_02_FULL_50_50]OGG88276.1 MAG: hypothetical protein A3G62_02525 [Candidatus Kaiserbacteria bacterium RIFCSPLOWO2_12_FULL_50_10]